MDTALRQPCFNNFSQLREQVTSRHHGRHRRDYRSGPLAVRRSCAGLDWISSVAVPAAVDDDDHSEFDLYGLAAPPTSRSAYQSASGQRLG